MLTIPEITKIKYPLGKQFCLISNFGIPQVYYDEGFGENVNYYCYTYHKKLCFTNLVQSELLC